MFLEGKALQTSLMEFASSILSLSGMFFARAGEKYHIINAISCCLDLRTSFMLPLRKPCRSSVT